MYRSDHGLNQSLNTSKHTARILEYFTNKFSFPIDSQKTKLFLETGRLSPQGVFFIFFLLDKNFTSTVIFIRQRQRQSNYYLIRSKQTRTFLCCSEQTNIPTWLIAALWRHYAKTTLIKVLLAIFKTILIRQINITKLSLFHLWWFFSVDGLQKWKRVADLISTIKTCQKGHAVCVSK